jgi:hypothetical protein
MPVETASFFAQVIQDHLELKQRNSELESAMPIDRYKADDPFDNHPLFKTEEQARIEETMDGMESDIVPPTGETVLAWPGQEAAEQSTSEPVEDSGLWSRSRDFDWGD